MRRADGIVTAVRTHARREGIPTETATRRFDSRSVPLFGEVGLAVAFNADRDARALAHAQVDGNDLGDAIPAPERWLATNNLRSRTTAAVTYRHL